jgi:hypothetical protein
MASHESEKSDEGFHDWLVILDISHSSDEVALVFTQLHHFLTLS